MPTTDPPGNIPNPDPSILTTAQLLRELANQKELVDATVGPIISRLDVMDRSIDSKVTHLRELHDEKFVSIDKQFDERDVRTDLLATGTKIAVDAALQAAKEAVGEQNKSSALAIAKSETATTKQIDQLQTLIQTNNDATNDKINDIKARLDRGEGGKTGVAADRTERHMDGTFVLAIIMAVTGVVSIVVAVGVAVSWHHP
jgi:predicted transcriptional regulator